MFPGINFKATILHLSSSCTPLFLVSSSWFIHGVQHLENVKVDPKWLKSMSFGKANSQYLSPESIEQAVAKPAVSMRHLWRASAEAHNPHLITGKGYASNQFLSTWNNAWTSEANPLGKNLSLETAGKSWRFKILPLRPLSASARTSDKVARQCLAFKVDWSGTIRLIQAHRLESTIPWALRRWCRLPNWLSSSFVKRLLPLFKE